jgi:hypothetical protein
MSHPQAGGTMLNDSRQTRIDQYLDYLVRQWEGIPALADEWDEWDEHSRLIFALDWPICEDRLGQLEAWVGQGLLTPTQQARYDLLLTLIVQHRPTLEQLLDNSCEPQQA